MPNGDHQQPVLVRGVEVPWFRESAFRAWVKGALTDLALAVGAVLAIFQGGTPEAQAKWWVPLALWAGLATKTFIQSAFDIFWGGEATYQKAPPPPPSTATSIPAPVIVPPPAPPTPPAPEAH